MGRDSGTSALDVAAVGTQGRLAVRISGGLLPPSLAGMGLRAGAEVEVVARAPLGGPVLVEIRATATRVAPGRELAGRLSVSRPGKAPRDMSALVAAAAACALAVAAPVSSRADEAAPRIRDNLFLLEEAYNQEPGVAQHIQLFQYEPENRAWLYSFTDEWPVPTDLNQLSVTVPVVGLGVDSRRRPVRALAHREPWSAFRNRCRSVVPDRPGGIRSGDRLAGRSRRGGDPRVPVARTRGVVMGGGHFAAG
ncbi:MAG: ferrous iron transport protein A [Deltaproteobacteria bacterium]|nr:ferrous iron transport protein A [Deltaproteobacteria bacterium]